MFFMFKRSTIVMIILALAVGIFFSAVIKIYANPDKKELPIIMYHSILKDRNYTGKYVVTPETIEEDIKYLKEKGYKSVLPSQVIAYVAGSGELPEKPYMMSFDDGSYNNLTYLLPLLEKYDECAVINIVGEYSQSCSLSGDTNPAYSYLKWEDISELSKTKKVEFGNHSYGFHKIDKSRIGAKIGKYENKEDYEKLFIEDTLKTESLLIENCNIKPVVYAYPYGAFCESSEKILGEMGYKITMTCAEGKNILTYNSSLNKLKRFNRSGNITTYDFFKRCGI